MILFALLGCISVTTFEAGRTRGRSVEPLQKATGELAFIAVGSELSLKNIFKPADSEMSNQKTNYETQSIRNYSDL